MMPGRPNAKLSRPDGSLYHPQTDPPNVHESVAAAGANKCSRQAGHRATDAAGVATGAVLAAAAVLRRANPVHPRGISYRATLGAWALHAPSTDRFQPEGARPC